MLDGAAVAAAFTQCGITHVIWIPDSATGKWNSALSSHPSFELVRVSREGEAFAIAAGLMIGGKRPIIQIQCTGLFEAGDSLRNFIHDMKLPLFTLIGLRSYTAYRQGKTRDTVPVFAESILEAWKIPYVILEESASAVDLAEAYLQAAKEKRAGAVFLAE
jgi:sulfopyruvate decarboxylase TPP-binding subunit